MASDRRRTLVARLLVAVVVASTLLVAPSSSMTVDAQTAAPAVTCRSWVGPGIAPPASVPSGIPGFHAAFYGASGYPSLCPGDTSTAIVAYYNSGSAGWQRCCMGKVAYLGTWDPEPGQDQPSPFGGNGANGSPNTGWPEYNRVAVQPAEWVGPNQVAWFQFTIKAPTTPGHYRLYVRPMIEGATWMEDYGVYWYIKVLNPDGSEPGPLPAVYTPLGYSYVAVPTPAGTFTAHVVKQRLSDVHVKTLTSTSYDCYNNCPAKPLADYVADVGGFAGMNGTYICPPDYASCAGKTNTYDYAVYNSTYQRWINARFLNGNSLATFVNGTGGTTPHFYSASSQYGGSAVSAGISMFPILMIGGSIVDTYAIQTDKQRQRNTKAAIAVDGINIYFVFVAYATINESAYVMQALGARDALNLDGGGTAALYLGGRYFVGPGRLLPNAVVLVRK